MKKLAFWTVFCTALTSNAMHMGSDDDKNTSSPKYIEMQNFSSKSPDISSSEMDKLTRQQLHVPQYLGSLNKSNCTTLYSHMYTLTSVNKKSEKE